MSATVSPPTYAEIRDSVAELLGAGLDGVGPDDDLIRQGIDSISMMTLAARWKARGIEVGFADLAERPTLAAWHELTGASAGPPPSAPPAIPDVDERAPFDLAPLQLAYWIGRAPGQPLGVGAHFYAELDGRDVSPARLEAAARALAARHGMLRARFRPDGRQEIAAESTWGGVRVQDLRDRPPDEREAALADLRERLAHRLLDVEHGEVFDLQLSLLDGGRTRLHVDIDMLAADAHSFRILLADLARLYAGERLEDLRCSYPGYLARRAGRDEAEVAAAREYWRARLDDLPGAPQLPLRVDPAELREPHVTRRYRWLAAGQSARLAERARAAGVTPSVVFATVFAEVLAAWSASPHFLLNLPVYDREPVHPDVPKLVGDFTNVTLLEVDAGAPASFAERALAVQAQLRRVARHVAYSGVDVLRDLARARPGSPGAPVVFTSAISLGELFEGDVRRSFGDPAWTTSQTPQVWLDCQVTERERGLYVNWDTVEDLFEAGVVDAMWGAFEDALEWLCADGADWDAQLPVRLPAAQRAVRTQANASDGPRPDRGLHEAFFAGAGARGDDLAVAGDGELLSHAGLRARALRVAGWLRERGVAAGDPVGVCLPKGPDQLVAVLGVLAAGAAYVPIGIDQPALRRERIVAGAGIDVVIDDVGAARDAAQLPRPVAVDPETPAYVIYTSGSTGEPKGVEVSHRAALNTIDAINDRWDLGAGDRCLAVSALDFDLSVFDVFGLLGAGGAVVVPGEDARRNARRWAQLVAEHGVTVLNCAPALLAMLVEAAAADELASLRLVLLGGDWVALDLPGRLHALAPGCRFVALGGTTETAIHSTVCEVTGGAVPPAWRSIPYGRPLRNQVLRVVDARGRDCPDWVVGEIWIGGDSVALGYRGDPQRTAARFVRHDERRYYRTGDLGRYWPDGTLEFLGRDDHQIKLRGHRIELGEIEAALESHPAVGRAIAVLVKAGGTPRLAVAYSGEGAGGHELSAHLAERVPAPMVPEQLLRLDPLPLSANGKIDRREIAAALAEQASAPSAGTPPRGDVEPVVAALWAELLELGDRPVRREDSFFALGGDSLVATRLISRLPAAGVEGAALRDVFVTPVLSAFCAGLRRADGDRAPAAPLAADPGARHEPFAPTDVQRAYWLGRRAEFSLGGVGSHWYWEFDGAGIDLDRLETAVNRLVERHEMLRAIFDADGNQRIQPEVPHVPVPVIDVAPEDADAALAELREELAYLRLDPERWPLFAVRAVRYGDRVRIGLGFDYIVLDALSIMIVFGELGRLYEEPGRELAPLELSFRDYLLNAEPAGGRIAAAQEYWRDRLDDLPPSPELPLAVDPATVSGARFTRRSGRLDRERWATLTRRGREHDLTPATLLATAYAEVLSAWSARPELTLNFTLFDRREVHPDVYSILGDFTSLMLVAHRGGAGSWAQAARALQEDVWDGMAHREVSAVWVVRELARRRQSPDVSMPVVFTSALGVAPGSFELNAPFGDLVWGLSQTPQVWLDCQVMEQDGELRFNWDAAEELFPAILDEMFAAFTRLLEWLADPGADWAGALPAMLPDAQRAVRDEVNRPRAPLPDRGLHEAFFAQAQARGDAPAVLWGADGRLSHADLRRRALQLAGLLREHGVAGGEPVLVTLPPGPEQAVAVLGVLAAGASYVPVGVEQPPARRARIAAGAGARLAVCAEGTELPGTVTAVTLERAARHAPLPAPVPVDPDALAYIIYTSGSTGEPKGVMVSHRAALNTIDAINDRWDVGPEDRVLAVSALDFDLSVYDIFGLLGVGGALVTPDPDQRLEPRHWHELLRRHRVTVWNTVPALLDMLLVLAADDGLPEHLRLALLSGDWIGLDLPVRLHALVPDCRFVAMGGATEAGIWSNAIEVDAVDPAWRSIPYGRPLRNQVLRVVDARGRDCPDWVVGEIWIGGDSVALGYRGDPPRTAAQFVSARGQRFYRTGDLGRYWPDGTLEFLGRRDHQIKLRGHRIELGEIEAALESHPAVTRGLVVLTGEAAARLVAVVAAPGGGVDEPALQDFLVDRLPGYMVPSRVHVLETLPLSTNGKVDRRAAELVVAGDGDAVEEEAPQGALEAEVAGLYGELLDLGGLSRQANFFALGGDSLLATRALEAIQRRHGLGLSLRELFGSPTVMELARLISAWRGADELVEEGVL